MWMQPPPPVDNHWVLHVAASPHEVDDALRELCVHRQARPASDPAYPAYLAGTSGLSQPPAWMTVAASELARRGRRTRWCTPDCDAHSWPADEVLRKHRQGVVAAARQGGPTGRPGRRSTREQT